VWIAYEWNYHRTARVILHEHLLECLDQFQQVYAGDDDGLWTVVKSLRETSVSIIQSLVDEVLSTVPQSLGDVDHEGNIPAPSTGTSICRGVGGYFLLWPMKIFKTTRSATGEQRITAREVFERIRECTGMKSTLGDASKI